MPAKRRCQFTGCTSAALRMIGECPNCSLNFCASHRLPEDHICPKLSDCRQQAFERNKARLESERTVANKMGTAQS
ncbi:hypothetical protein DACRYDRAFT_19903 [Dacryopinax primogenitus]|uniref:AN1-type domain-containing protein n=1 Tax=Dacryopinax primogenitus (strain DJM 731) TaxID=1858805 RepID=M5G550_DACPD|nr:uncharacterized protein DACRYDRAFT_19903 [Dacryopinax primogenitus]EJU05386.1 hypothetical protein DACRYDRAFT_19903 [Dacryopinax primogenitus]